MRAISCQYMLFRAKEVIRDICGLLSANGVKVLPYQASADAFFGLSVGAEDGGPAVVVNVFERISVERWIFTAAHELGHIVMHRGSFDVNEKAEEKSEENEANWFASEFLMPDILFRKEWSETRGLDLVHRVFKLKRIFRVSYQTVLRRLAENRKAEGNEDAYRNIYALWEPSYERFFRPPSPPKNSSPKPSIPSASPKFCAPTNASNSPPATLSKKACKVSSDRP